MPTSRARRSTRLPYAVAARIPGAQSAAGRVSDGTRTRDRLDHNQELYLLSYAHHGRRFRRRSESSTGFAPRRIACSWVV